MEYDCETCKDKNCKICPACGNQPVLDVTDNYRSKVATGYYSSSIIEVTDKEWKKEICLF